MNIDIDIIVYAVLACLFLGRLWMVLGRRNDVDKQRPNPFGMPIIRVQPNTNPPAADAPRLLPAPNLAPASLEGGLQQIKEKIVDFNEKQFLQTAKFNFVTIVEDFAKGDITRLSAMLTPAVQTHFQNALTERQKTGQTIETRVVDVREAETTAARLDGSRAFITVHFVSHQQNILRDSSGQIIGGEVGKTEEISDIWSFTRDVTNPKSEWLLAETSA